MTKKSFFRDWETVIKEMPIKIKRKRRPVFYLAHSFSERHWVRDVLMKRLQRAGIQTLNPFYNPDGSWKEDRPEVKHADLHGGITTRFKRIVQRHAEEIVETDLAMIRRAVRDGGGVVGYMVEPTVGTSSELFYCGYVLKAPTYLLTPNTKLRWHPWLRYYCVIVPSIRQLILKIKELYKIGRV